MVAIDIESEEGQREALRRMLTIRAFDTKAGDLFGDGELPGFVHLYIGEEAVAVGACSALEEEDYITSTHRGHGHCIAKGLEPEQMMSELYGKRDGYCNGKGGSMHIADVDAGMLGANGIVGAGPPLATGAALTSHLRGEDTVALAFFGDGAVAQGQIHEAINIAATWNLPAIFLVENNQFGEGTPVEKQHNVQHLSETAEAYNIPGFTVDGMDVTAVFEAVREARKRALDGEGPTFIEADTYRYRGHFEGDQQPYRTKEDVAIWQDRDAIESFKQKLVDAGTITEAEFDEMESEIHDRIEKAAADAKEAPYPDPSEAYEDMFSATVPEINEFARQMRADGGERQ
ncbi:thiamine pyrophosphate-dependent dehydrogenase E1 component subunit alpha [Halogranum rubrum]|uniref:2-oxoacid dehydrogenase E1 component alpha subunit n=1 Tax=Halogranum salarium B-1 TaxID=1210908 RepID=J2ZJ69_9EURY|nr:thiamine pyrophosphate-dependent dehydrogenase E1 component subunit alpha [Halogranum salarium]EJN60750.1 2-oxoacid dehydrogenase E1 component alpha subunit [Halogranum salarium B-1]